MGEQKFTLDIENKHFNFELDKEGTVWIIENNKKHQMPEGTNIGQTRPVSSLEEAKEVGKIMLYASRRINKLEP